jgi:hypothetical protein
VTNATSLTEAYADTRTAESVNNTNNGTKLETVWDIAMRAYEHHCKSSTECRYDRWLRERLE